MFQLQSKLFQKLNISEPNFLTRHISGKVFMRFLFNTRLLTKETQNHKSEKQTLKTVH